ncbi:MAG: DUF637 domain-containing protein [Betaproteobacteria bacterium]|nr:DUF637 domain-containing protein [Betaproteobacteria bacterium]
MWQSAKGEGWTEETLHLPDIQAYAATTVAPTIGAKGAIGGVETTGGSDAPPLLASLSPTLNAPGGIVVGATELPTTQAEAGRSTFGSSGGSSNGTVPPTVKIDLKAQAEILAQQPGLAWLGELAQREDVDWQKIALIHDQWDYKQSGLTREGGAVIAIVVAILTWGWGSTLATTGTVAADGAVAASTVGGMTVSTTTAAGVTSYTALGATLNAGFTTLATQTSVSLINNKGDIGQTLKDLGSSDSVKQLVAAMLTGVLEGITVALSTWKACQNRSRLRRWRIDRFGMPTRGSRCWNDGWAGLDLRCHETESDRELTAIQGHLPGRQRPVLKQLSARRNWWRALGLGDGVPDGRVYLHGACGRVCGDYRKWP